MEKAAGHHTNGDENSILRKVMIMNHRTLRFLYVTQFLSAFADNAVLLIILGLLKANGFSESALALVSASFFVPYIVLAPLVGAFADKKPKAFVLMCGNLIKSAGVLLLIIDYHQMGVGTLMFCYFVLGGGAACYSAAKYSILTELTSNEQELFQANGRIEGYTIIAILLGIGCGGFMVDKLPLMMDVFICLGLFVCSLIMTFFIPRREGNPSINYRNEFRQFSLSVSRLLRRADTRYSLVGTGSFWMSSAILRVAVLAWIPVALGITSTDFKAALILATTSIGIIIGAFLAPKLVPLSSFYRSSTFGLGMLVIIMTFPWIRVTVLSIILLLLVGFMGGVYIIPQNTVLQEEGTKMVGAGKTIAVQNLIENSLMLVGTAVYFFLTSILDLSVSMAITMTGMLFGGFILYLYSQLQAVKKILLEKG
jgi:MFS transporter, LPLT family, lysophospholipid transporter